jgi:hypothetical protein
MATALEILTRAGKRAKILADEATYTASEAVDALQLLNDLMHAFGPKGIAYAHTTLASGDTVNVPDEQLRNLTLMMTRELLIDFAMPIDEVLAAEIIAAENELQAAYHVSEPAVSDPLLRSRRPVGGNVSRLD